MDRRVLDPPSSESLAPMDKIGSYLIGKTLGEGAFAKVKAATHAISGQHVAMKIIAKYKIKEEYVRKNLYREGNLMKKIRHPHIIQLYEIIETEKYYCLVTELAGGGEVLDYIVAHGSLPEKEVKKYIRQLVSAVSHLHAANIVHRDLKAENLLLDENLNIKIIDFGLSNSIEGRTGLTTQCGSPAYTAPELLAGKEYGPQVDVWSIGVNLYAMLTGRLPFASNNVATLHALILEQKYHLPRHLSDACKDVITRLLKVRPTDRLSLEGLLAHPWLQGDEPVILYPPFIPPSPEDVDFKVCQYLVRQGCDMDALVASVSTHACNHLSASYYLVLEKFSKLAPQQKKPLSRSMSDGKLGLKLKAIRETMPQSKHSNVSQAADPPLPTSKATRERKEGSETEDGDKPSSEFTPPRPVPPPSDSEESERHRRRHTCSTPRALRTKPPTPNLPHPPRRGPPALSSSLAHGNGNVNNSTSSGNIQAPLSPVNMNTPSLGPGPHSSDYSSPDPSGPSSLSSKSPGRQGYGSQPRDQPSSSSHFSASPVQTFFRNNLSERSPSSLSMSPSKHLHLPDSPVILSSSPPPLVPYPPSCSPGSTIQPSPNKPSYSRKSSGGNSSENSLSSHSLDIPDDHQMAGPNTSHGSHHRALPSLPTTVAPLPVHSYSRDNLASEGLNNPSSSSLLSKELQGLNDLDSEPVSSSVSKPSYKSSDEHNPALSVASHNAAQPPRLSRRSKSVLTTIPPHETPSPRASPMDTTDKEETNSSASDHQRMLPHPPPAPTTTRRRSSIDGGLPLGISSSSNRLLVPTLGFPPTSLLGNNSSSPSPSPSGPPSRTSPNQIQFPSRRMLPEPLDETSSSSSSGNKGSRPLFKRPSIQASLYQGPPLGEGNSRDLIAKDSSQVLPKIRSNSLTNDSGHPEFLPRPPLGPTVRGGPSSIRTPSGPLPQAPPTLPNSLPARTVRYPFNKQMVTPKDPEFVFEELQKVLRDLGVDAQRREQEPFCLDCFADNVEFDAEVVAIPGLTMMHGVKLRRVKGGTQDYQELCSLILGSLKF